MTDAPDPVDPLAARHEDEALVGEIRHGKWTIYPTDPLPPIPTWRQFAWSYVHEDYDGAEDAGDSRFGYAPTPEACIAEIENRDD
jgi:hypothetical protein